MPRLILPLMLQLSAAFASSSHHPLPTSSSSDKLGSPSACCSLLQSALPGLVSYPGDAVYETEQNGTGVVGYWSTQDSELRPACRVTPTASRDVSSAVLALVSQDCRFTVRSGGHTPWPGASNIGPEGIAIDLSRLNNVTLNNDQSVVHVGPGARWKDVYLVLDSLGLATSGGRVSSVGVGGLTLGGGKSFFSGKHGFVCDNVVNFEIVTASGSIINANNTANPDLYKALKGGSGNFGVVTRLDLKTFKQGKMWAGQISYPADTLPAQLEALRDFTEASSVSTDSAESEVIFAYVLVGPEQFVSNFYSNTAPEANPPILHNFTSIQPQLSDSTKISNLTEFSIELNAGTPNGNRYLFATATFGNDLELFKELAQLANSTWQPFVAANTSDMVFSFVLQPLTKPMLSFGCEKNALGLCPSAGNLMILDITMQWGSAADDAKVNAAAKTLVKGAERCAKARGVHNPYIYLNYAAEWQKPILSYGRQSVRELRRVSREFDPTQAFQRLVGGQKLS